MTDQAEADRPDHQASFRVHGRVQGVGFRWWTRRTADSLGLAGSVRNLPDGTVEVRARGALAAVRELQSRLEEGPPSASVRRVERVEIRKGEIPRDGFRIER